MCLNIVKQCSSLNNVNKQHSCMPTNMHIEPEKLKEVICMDEVD